MRRHEDQSAQTIPYIRSKWSKLIPYFRPKRLKPFGAAHTYIAHIREPPPPAPPPHPGARLYNNPKRVSTGTDNSFIVASFHWHALQ